MGLMLFITLGLLVTVESNAQNPMVHTTKGPVRGFIQQSSKGKAFYSFMSIPYATPPHGKLRFKPPEPAEKWSHPLEGTSPPPNCIQFDNFLTKSVMGEEDCLYLNVYSRELSHKMQNPKLPVMVWIHDGAFTMGSGSAYSPSLLLNENIVLVTINYRLGPFGFMSTADDVIQGNMGLKDQNLALRWVKENIYAFGGDPDRITIFGESAGSASVHYHLLSPMSKGLFNRAISQSGTALDYWAYLEPRELASRSKRLASWLDCPTDNSEDMLQCMQLVDYQKVASLVPKFVEWYLFPLAPFTPTMEVAGHVKFMDKSPQESLLQGHDVNDVNWLVGHTDSEGEFLAVGISATQNLLEELDEKYLELFPLVLGYKHMVDNHDEYSRRIRKYYFGNKAISQETLPAIIQMFCDSLMNYWGYIAIRHHQTALVTSSVYYYLLTYKASSISFSTSPEFDSSSYQSRDVSHGEDIQYFFQFPLVPPFKEGSPEEKMSQKMITWWVNFASTGNPTPFRGAESQIIWDPLEGHHFNYFNITLPPKMQTDFIYDHIAFWRQLFHDMAASKSTGKEEL